MTEIFQALSLFCFDIGGTYSSSRGLERHWRISEQRRLGPWSDGMV